MTEFIDALFNPDILFLRYAFIAGIMASVAFGIIGTYVVVRRISYLAGAVSHCVLGGIGAGLFLQNNFGLQWCDPMYLAIVTAILSAIIIGVVSLNAQQREDSTIGAIWATGMAIGLLFIAQTPGYVDPMVYLFGNILLIGPKDLWLIAGLDILIIIIGVLFFNKFMAVCFDEEFLTIRGIRADIYYLLLLCLTALTVVLMVRIVGIVMVIALLTLPASVAAYFSKRMAQMMLISVIVCMLFISTGLAVSYTSNLPSGPVIIVLAGIVYLTTALIKIFSKALFLTKTKLYFILRKLKFLKEY